MNVEQLQPEQQRHGSSWSIALPLLAFMVLLAMPALSSVRIALSAPAYAGRTVTLYRYMDLFTLRTEHLADAHIDAHGDATLQCEVNGTNKAMIRIGEVMCDLWLRDGSYSITLPAPDAATPRSLNGTRVDPLFKDLDQMDINALLSDLNERLDGFIAQDLATDSKAGMSAVDAERRNPGTLRPDTAKRPATLFISPSWSSDRVDSFGSKLRKFYGPVKDPWFWQDLDYGLAGLLFGPRANDKALFDRFLKDRPVLYDTPEYVRFFNDFFEDHLMRFPFRTNEIALTAMIRAADVDSVKRILASHDFLHDDRLCELVLINELYRNYHGRTFDRDGMMRMLRHIASSSTYPEHRRIASDMVWDLTVMRAGGALPSLALRSMEGAQVRLDSLGDGPLYLVVTAGWCTYCEQEMVALEALYEEYGPYVRFIAVSLDHDMKDLVNYTRAHAARDWTWVYGGDDPAVQDALRLRNIPAFFVVNDGKLLFSPAPPPSNGAASLFFKLKAQADERNKLRPDQGPPPRH